MPNVTQLIVAKLGLEHNGSVSNFKLYYTERGQVHLQDLIFRACRQPLGRSRGWKQGSAGQSHARGSAWMPGQPAMQGEGKLLQ